MSDRKCLTDRAAGQDKAELKNGRRGRTAAHGIERLQNSSDKSRAAVQISDFLRNPKAAAAFTLHKVVVAVTIS
ncbi:MAG: hypothetical protein ACK4HF_17480 [Paracoccaceae bacterium]